MRPNRMSRVGQPYVTVEPTASHVLPNRISRVRPKRMSRVGQPHVTCKTHVRCGLSTDYKHCFISTGLNPFSTVRAARAISTGQQLVPSLRDGDEKSAGLSATSKSILSLVGMTKKALVQV